MWLNKECKRPQGKNYGQPALSTIKDSYKIGIVDCPKNNNDCKSLNYFLRDQDVMSLIERCCGPQQEGAKSFYSRFKKNYHTYFAEGYGSPVTYELGYQPSDVPMVVTTTSSVIYSDDAAKDNKQQANNYVPDYENMDVSEFEVDVVDLTSNDNNNDSKKPAATFKPEHEPS